MTASRFVVGPDEKVLVVAGRKKDFQPWIDRHPKIQNSIIFAFEDENVSREVIPVGVKGILFERHLNHPDSERLKKSAQKNGVLFTRFFSRKIELTNFLELSILVNGQPAGVQKNLEMREEKVVDSQSIGASEVVQKREVGEVKNFVLANADFKPKVTKEEITRLFDLSKEKGIQTTWKSLEVAFYTARRTLNISSSIPTNKSKKEKVGKTSRSILADYVNVVREFNGASEIAAVAIKELLEQTVNDQEKQEWQREKQDLLAKNKSLEKEVARLKGDFKKRLSAFVKGL